MSIQEEALATRPKTVAICGMGPSLKDYLNERFRKKHPSHVDEVWGVNTVHRAIDCDKIWIMDDLKEGLSHNYPDWSNELKTLDKPIMTCREYPEFPNSVAYPLESIQKELHSDYFSNTPAYMIAYAIHIKVETLFLFGIDFHYPNAQIVESGLGCVGYWLGRAEEHGVQYKIPGSSTLLDANLVQEIENEDGSRGAKRLLYGYDYNPQDAKRRADRGDKDPAVTAISERAYKHSESKEVETK